MSWRALVIPLSHYVALSMDDPSADFLVGQGGNQAHAEGFLDREPSSTPINQNCRPHALKRQGPALTHVFQCRWLNGLILRETLPAATGNLLAIQRQDNSTGHGTPGKTRPDIAACHHSRHRKRIQDSRLISHGLCALMRTRRIKPGSTNS